MRICTWNVNSIRVRKDHAEALYKHQKIDVLCLQETKVENVNYPKFTSICSTNGQKAYNGVSVHTKKKHQDVLINPLNDKTSRVIAFTYKNIRFVNIYVPNGGKNEVAYFDKLDWLEELCVYLSEEMNKHKNLIVLGDFNICPTDDDVWNPTLWENQITCTEAERQCFDNILNIGLFDAVKEHDSNFTWWNYQQKSLQKNHGLRIDHVLVSKNLKKYVKHARVLKEYRSMIRPSDHAPVMVEIKK